MNALFFIINKIKITYFNDTHEVFECIDFDYK